MAEGKTVESAKSVKPIAISGDKVEVVGIPSTRIEPEMKVGLAEDIQDIKRRIRGLTAKALRIGLNTPVSSVVTDVVKFVGVVDERWLRYTTIQVQNGLQEDFFRKVPREERVVFVPHCLRDVKNCAATIDEEGYHCKRCGRCIIAKISEECEKNGMRMFMCGGGSQVLNLIKKYKPKAIVGVACFKEIQLALEGLKLSNIPTQSVMLKRDGCVNTEVDFEEIKEKLNL